MLRRWNNLKGGQSKYAKAYNAKSFKPSSRKLSDKRLETEKAVHQEKVKLEAEMFAECVELIGKLKGCEILVRSSQPKTAAEVVEVLGTAEAHRKSIRELRLQQYEEYAQNDQKFQTQALLSLQRADERFEAMMSEKKRTNDLLERWVIAYEARNK